MSVVALSLGQEVQRWRKVSAKNTCVAEENKLFGKVNTWPKEEIRERERESRSEISREEKKRRRSGQVGEVVT